MAALGSDADRDLLTEVVATPPAARGVAPSTLSTARSMLTEVVLTNTTRHPFVACSEE